MPFIKINHIKFFLAIAVLVSGVFTGGCRKDSLTDSHPAIVQVFNAMDDGVSLYTNLSGKHPINYTTSMSLANKYFLRSQYTLFINEFPAAIDLYARPDTMPHNQPVLSASLDVKAGSMYSLFIHGAKESTAYTLLENKFPVGSSDSVTYIRFANFSEGQSISVNRKGEPDGSFVQDLPFGSQSEFITLPALRSVKNYEFEIKDQLTGVVLATYTTPDLFTKLSNNPWVFKPNTLVFTGIRNSASPNNQKIVWMSHMEQ